MKKLWRIGILLIIVLSAACCLWIYRSRSGSATNGGAIIQKPKSFSHLPLTQLRQSGSVMTGRLESPMVIDGYPCDANWVHFTDTGKLKAFFLSDACLIRGNKIPQGTWIQLNPDQTVRFCSFPEDTVIQGHVCHGTGGAKGATASFYPSGRLGGFYPPADVEIQGIPIKASPINGVGLHENGSLREFTLSRDAVISGRSLSAGQHVVLDEQGNVKSVVSPPFYERPLAWITGFFPGS
jgi:hypothetical protein